jgi:chromosome segregation ATPase
MSEPSVPITPEQCLSRLKEMDGERETLIRRQAALGERHGQAQKELHNIIEQMKAAGTSPQTIQADLSRESELLIQATAEYESSLQTLRSQLDGADASLAALEKKGKV